MKELIAQEPQVTDSRRVPISTNPCQLWVTWSLPWPTCPWVKRKWWCRTVTPCSPNCFRMPWVATARLLWLLRCLQLISIMMKLWELWGAVVPNYVWKQYLKLKYIGRLIQNLNFVSFSLISVPWFILIDKPILDIHKNLGGLISDCSFFLTDMLIVQRKSRTKLWLMKIQWTNWFVSYGKKMKS